jgi:hypothetical protein
MVNVFEFIECLRVQAYIRCLSFDWFVAFLRLSSCISEIEQWHWARWVPLAQAHPLWFEWFKWLCFFFEVDLAIAFSFPSFWGFFVFEFEVFLRTSHLKTKMWICKLKLIAVLCQHNRLAFNVSKCLKRIELLTLLIFLCGLFKTNCKKKIFFLTCYFFIYVLKYIKVSGP